jgi:hypothetical protein
MEICCKNTSKATHEHVQIQRHSIATDGLPFNDVLQA